MWALGFQELSTKMGDWLTPRTKSGGFSSTKRKIGKIEIQNWKIGTIDILPHLFKVLLGIWSVYILHQCYISIQTDETTFVNLPFLQILYCTYFVRLILHLHTLTCFNGEQNLIQHSPWNVVKAWSELSTEHGFTGHFHMSLSLLFIHSHLCCFLI